ncbi:MAG: hypothetical protein RLZZ628_293 [Bacteroidota bacterium]|jgi:outer membrane receptor protein involved in Fe transport
MKKMKKGTLLLSICCLVNGLMAQTVVKGKVTAADNQEPLVGASVQIQGTTIGTITNGDGNYQFTIPAASGKSMVLEASFTGYKTENRAVTIGSALEIFENFQLAEGAALSEIIVSANKKSERLQDVPMSISVLSPKELQRSGSTQFRDYASSIPNLSFGTQGGGGAFNDGRTSNQISLRGITGANTTAMYLDETPLPANIDPRLIDVARVEVLRGPQGTLYGSSTMGGAVKVVTNQPNGAQKEGSASVTFGKVQEGTFDYGANGVINLPLNADKTLALRATGFYDFQTGVYDRVAVSGVNILNKATLNQTIAGDPQVIPTENCTTCASSNKDNVDAKTAYGFQASLGYYPTKNISIIPKVIWQTQSGTGYDFADGNTKNFKQVRGSSVDEKFSDTWGHYSLSANFGLPNGKIVSSTSYTDRTYKEQEDEGEFIGGYILHFPDSTKDFWAGVINRDGRFKKFVQEIRYQSEFKSPFNWTMGAYYGDESLTETAIDTKKGLISYLGAPPALEASPWFSMNNSQKVTEMSVFGEVYYDVTPAFRLTAGLRYFNATSKRAFSATGAPFDYDETKVDQNIKESGVNPKLNLTYKLSPNQLFYATVSKGYRLGGLNYPFPTVWCAKAIAELGGQPPASYKSDFLWNYEAGFKSVSAGGKVVLNAAFFYNDWSNLQQRRFFPDCGLGFVSNVGSASSTGLEVEASANAAKGLDLGIGIGLLNAKIKETGTGLDAKVGDKILFTPNTTFSANAQYTVNLSGGNQLYVRANLQNVGERYSSFNKAPERTLAAYTLMNARVGYITKRLEINLFCNNLTGEQANFGDVTSLAAETPGRPRYMTNRPRTVGLLLKTYF